MDPHPQYGDLSRYGRPCRYARRRSLSESGRGCPLEAHGKRTDAACNQRTHKGRRRPRFRRRQRCNRSGRAERAEWQKHSLEGLRGRRCINRQKCCHYGDLVCARRYCKSGIYDEEQCVCRRAGREIVLHTGRTFRLLETAAEISPVRQGICGRPKQREPRHRQGI